MLSNYFSNIANEYGINSGNVNKLIPNLGNKSKLVLHYKNLQLHFLLGIKLIKVHRILKFKQIDQLKTYIDLIQKKEKTLLLVLKNIFLKLINNIAYSKTMKNLRNIIKVKQINNAKDYKKYLSKPSFLLQRMLSENAILRLNQF